MRIEIDWDLCQGHANCMGDVPEVFHVDEAGKLTVLQPEPPQELRDRVKMAEQYCPTGAISVVD